MNFNFTDDNKSKAKAIGFTAIVAGLLTWLGILGIGVYGMALFVLTPLFIGACPVIIYGSSNPVTPEQARRMGYITLGIFCVGLIVFAIEGLICVFMAAPFGIVLTWVGSLIGLRIVGHENNVGCASLIILTLAIPTTSFVEKMDDSIPDLISVHTAIEIDARPEDVWKSVIEFPKLNTPKEFLFKAGIAYPINAEILGEGVGAVRHCNFSTGSFVEPITVWDEPRLLEFDVTENPPPMKEISFYDINAPHLHDYFVSKHGQFKLTELSNGRTLLEGTTWYYHDIRPVFYWRLWSDYIIHKIHNRVLTHIKETTENGNK